MKTEWQKFIDECESMMSNAEHRKKVAEMDYHTSEIQHQEGRWHCANDLRKWAEAAAPKPEPAETVEGLEEAIEWAIASNWVSYGIDGGAEIKNKVIIKWNEAILQAARLWLRKQGE